MSKKCRRMISVTPLWNSNRSSKPAPRALRSTSLKEKCHISSALTAKSESLSHTSQSVTATHCRATITFSTTEPHQKKALQMSSAFWSSPAYMVCLRGSWMTTPKRMGNSLEMSNRILRDTAVKLQPIIKACTACASEQKPPQRNAASHPLSAPRARLCHTHLSKHDHNTLARWSESLHNRTC